MGILETHPGNLERKAARGGVAMVISKMLNQAIGIGVVWIQVHYLSVWAYGVFELFMGTVVFINTLGNVGASDIVRRFIPEFIEKNERNCVAVTIRILLIVRLVASAIFLVFAVLFFDKFGDFFNIEEYEAAFTLFAIGALATTEAVLMNYVYWAMLKQVQYSIVFTIYNITRFAAFYWVLNIGGGLPEVIAVDACSNLLLFLGLYLPFARRFDAKGASDKSRPPVKRMAKYGLFMYLNNLGNIFFNMTTDKYVISAVMGKMALGYYSFAVRVAMAASKWMPDQLVGSAIEPFIYRDYTRRNSEDVLSEQFSKIVTFEAFFVLPTMVFVLIFSQPLIRYVFDPKYLPATWILAGLAVVFAISTLRFPLVLVATAKERVKLLFATQTVFAIYNLVADIVLVKAIGLWGAVVATGTAIVFLIITLWIGLSREVLLKIEGGAVGKIFVNTTLMGGFFYLARSRISSLWTLIAAFLVGGSLYLLLSYINPPYDRETLRFMWNIIKRGKRSENNTPIDSK